MNISISPQTTLDNDTNNDTIIIMATVDNILAQMMRNARAVRFSDLCKVCDHFFGDLVKVGAVIEFTRPRGRVIPE